MVSGLPEVYGRKIIIFFRIGRPPDNGISNGLQEEPITGLVFPNHGDLLHLWDY